MPEVLTVEENEALLNMLPGRRAILAGSDKFETSPEACNRPFSEMDGLVDRPASLSSQESVWLANEKVCLL
jgi:hypothetical protein